MLQRFWKIILWLGNHEMTARMLSQRGAVEET